MHLKEAFEAVTDNVDVRPGFVGDVMTGARKRRTRKLLVATAVVALVAGGVAGGLLTRQHQPELTTIADQRFEQPTRGELANDETFLSQVDTVWKERRATGTFQTDSDVMVSDYGETHVYWAGRMSTGPAAVVLQKVPQGTLLVFVGTHLKHLMVLAYETPGGGYTEQGVFQYLGEKDAHYLVLQRAEPIQYSIRAVRGQDGKLTRDWRELPMKDGVAEVTASKDDKPLFSVGTPPKLYGSAESATALLSPRVGHLQTAFAAHSGVGWDGTKYASGQPAFEPSGTSMDPFQILRDRGMLDYGPVNYSSKAWRVIAAMPDGRTAVVFEIEQELFAVLYHPNGELSDVLVGGKLTRETRLPVSFVLPNNQGIVVIAYGALLGPNEKADAWLAPAGTTEVRVRTGETVSNVPLLTP